MRAHAPSLRGAVAASAVAAALSLLAPSVPTTDPWGWIVWGREVVDLRLDTLAGPPSWKPLPVLFTAPFSLLGTAAPDAWLLVARAGGLLALILAFRVAASLAGRAAGVVAVLALALSGGWLRGLAHGYSEGLAVALLLAGVELARAGRPRAALAMGTLVALARPEAWPLAALYGIVVAVRGGRRQWLPVLALLALPPVLWVLPDWWGAGDPLHAATVARVNLTRSGPHPGWTLLRRAFALLPPPVWLLAAAAVTVAAVRRRRERTTAFAAARERTTVAATTDTHPHDHTMLAVAARERMTFAATTEARPRDRTTPAATVNTRPSDRTTPAATAETRPRDCTTPAATAETRPSDRTTPAGTADTHPHDRTTPAAAADTRPRDRTTPAAAARDRATLALGATAATWIAFECVATELRYPGAARFLVPPAALVCVLAGAGAAWLVRLVPTGRGRIVCAAALAAAALPFAFAPLVALPRSAHASVVRARFQIALNRAVARAGGPHVLRAGVRPTIPSRLWWNAGDLAWDLGVPLDRIRKIPERDLATLDGLRPPAILFTPLGGTPPDDPAWRPTRRVARRGLAIRVITRSGPWRVLAITRLGRAGAPRRSRVPSHERGRGCADRAVDAGGRRGARGADVRAAARPRAPVAAVLRDRGVLRVRDGRRRPHRAAVPGTGCRTRLTSRSSGPGRPGSPRRAPPPAPARR